LIVIRLLSVVINAKLKMIIVAVKNAGKVQIKENDIINYLH
jgi:hypothetical protein